MAMHLWREAVAQLTRNYPFYSGAGLLANHPLVKLFVPDSPEQAWAKTAGGELRVLLDDHVGRAIYYFGDLDPKVSWVVQQLVKPGDCVLDVGANFGILTLLMSKLVGSQGRVHSFEPNPLLCKTLSATLAHNGIENVQLHHFALGAEDGELPLNVPKGNFGRGSLASNSEHGLESRTVSIRRLDDLVSHQGVSRIALMKIDVEGFELQVLMGSQHVLEAIRPSAIVFEANDTAARDQVMELLHRLGYEFMMIPRCICRMRIDVVDLDRMEKITGHDLIAAPKGEAFERLRVLLRAS
jgi:FkbM family methyltransferase